MAITGKKVRGRVSREEIFKKVSPYDVYKFYMPWKFELNRMCKNPFVKETNPSFIIGTKFGDITHKAFNSEHRGDCINFVRDMFGVGYVDALYRIATDFHLIDDNEEEYKRIVEAYKTPPIIKKIPDFIQVKARPFSKQELEYLCEFHISPRSLDIFPDTKVVGVAQWSLNRLKMPLGPNEICFAYHLKNEEGEWVKVYRPNASKKDKWKSSVPLSQINGLSTLEECEKLVICKSVKEAAILKEYIGIQTLVVQAENLACFTPKNIDKINSLCPMPYCSFDIDEPGKRANWGVTHLTGWKHVNVNDKYLSEGIKDWGDLIKKYGPEVIIEHFKSKKII